MRKHIMSFAASLTYKPEHPERTAQRNFGEWDVMFQVWPSRAAMLKTIDLQSRATPRQDHWRPCVREGKQR